MLTFYFSCYNHVEKKITKTSNCQRNVVAMGYSNRDVKYVQIEKVHVTFKKSFLIAFRKKLARITLVQCLHSIIVEFSYQLRRDLLT